MNKRYCLTLDLIPNDDLIAGYEEMHRKVWPEIIESITTAGIEDMEIYRTGNRLFMIMEVNDTFSFDRKSEMDAGNEKVQEWETLMWKYQQAVPGAKPGEKWIMMDRIFELNA
ncbi:MAG: L-rhamnose mutarotase [Candidatus Pedobacter colombiensis]|uniref:L-rhamnose mutarotase n=1 Tax=Candidatus Pedobacter colombiensis TaxID=3121371 RepID=A0AAJ5W7P0_9SPHI|nr:L-rhamnose mutarotase [Pedobacter sp.]WEK19626.1 MAG: L-rhamnose mutarotase [Pedobacter sp.]